MCARAVGVNVCLDDDVRGFASMCAEVRLLPEAARSKDARVLWHKILHMFGSPGSVAEEGICMVLACCWMATAALFGDGIHVERSLEDSTQHGRSVVD